MPRVTLKEIQYSEYKEKPREWILSKTQFGEIALIVGVNSSGKSRTLNVISSLAALISGIRKPFSADGEYSVRFSCTEGSADYLYRVAMVASEVISEQLEKDGKIILNRNAEGEGSIRAIKAGVDLDFKVPKNQLAILAKRDQVQHPFLEPIHEWATGIIHHRFADDNEKDSIVAFAQPRPDIDPFTMGVVILKRSLENDKDFESALISDMEKIGYKISSVNIEYPIDLPPQQGQRPVCISVKENELEANTQQKEMSHGMFRALNTLIKLNYMIRDKTMSLMLIDDVGEGLDFSRSKKLVALILDKAKHKSKQVLMTTNDQFIMNGVPLDYWSIAKREANRVSYRDITNSKETFENFKFIGLNNFEFFSSEFFLR